MATWHCAEDLTQVGSIFKTADPITGVQGAKGAQCTLKQLQSSLLMHGFAYKTVSALVDRARGKARAGAIDSEAFAEILHAFKREQAHDVQPPCGLDNSIHVLVIHGGFASSVLPVLHCLGERVFPRLSHAAMQLGGTCAFEHISLSDDSLHGQARQGGQAMTMQGVLAYAASCSASSAHVWLQVLPPTPPFRSAWSDMRAICSCTTRANYLSALQFVLDESVAASMLPVSVSSDAFENFVGRAQEEEEEAGDGEGPSFARLFKAIYAKSARGSEYELSADKRHARAAKRLLTQILAYAYQPKSASASDPRNPAPLVAFGAGTRKDAGARAQKLGGEKPREELRCAPACTRASN